MILQVGGSKEFIRKFLDLVKHTKWWDTKSAYKIGSLLDANKKGGLSRKAGRCSHSVTAA